MRIVLAAILLSVCAPSMACDGLQVEKAWVRLPPPGAAMTAGYALLGNRRDAPLEISAVSSPDYGSATLHRTVEEDGMSRMRGALPLSLPAGSRQALEPGGYHLMLSKPAEDPKAGETVRITFHCGTEASSFPFALLKDAP